MISAAKMSEAIRMKRKKLKEDGVDNMIDTSAKPQMNPQDIWNEEKMAQHEETIPGADEIMAGPGTATMEEPQMDDSQDTAVLAKKMAMIKKIFDSL